MIKAHALHVIRSLVSPPEYTLLPPYISPDNLDNYLSDNYNSRMSVGCVSTPGNLHQTPYSKSVDKFETNWKYHSSNNYSTPSVVEIDSNYHSNISSHNNNNNNNYLERPLSPSSSVSSFQCIPIATLIERAQKIAREVIRKCNGIHIIAATLEITTLHYIHNIRLAILQVFNFLF